MQSHSVEAAILLSTFSACLQTGLRAADMTLGDLGGGGHCPAENTLMAIGLVSCYLSCQGDSLQGDSLQTTGTSHGTEHGLEG